MDWRVFIGEKIAADLKARADAVRSVDATHLVASHAPNPSPVFRTLADAMDASDDYLMKHAVDHFGTSFYPKLTSPDRDFPLERRALVMDMVRAVTGDAGFYERVIRDFVATVDVDDPEVVPVWATGGQALRKPAPSRMMSEAPAGIRS